MLLAHPEDWILFQSKGKASLLHFMFIVLNKKMQNTSSGFAVLAALYPPPPPLVFEKYNLHQKVTFDFYCCSEI